MLAKLVVALLALCASSAVGVQVIAQVSSTEASLASFHEHAAVIDVVAPHAFTLGDDGVVWGQVDPRLALAAKEHRVRLLPSIAAASSDDLHALLHSRTARRRAAAALVNLATRHSFYGWQLTVESVDIADAEELHLLVQEISNELRANQLKFAVAIIPSPGADGIRTAFLRHLEATSRGAANLARMADVVDWLSLITHAQHSAQTPPGPVASTAWLHEVIQHTLGLGFSPSKIVLGIPVFSLHWHPTVANGKATSTVSRLSFQDALALVERNEASQGWLEGDEAPFAHWTTGGVKEWLFLENVRSFQSKIEMFETYAGLRGISLWTLGEEDPELWLALEEARIEQNTAASSGRQTVHSEL